MRSPRATSNPTTPDGPSLVRLRTGRPLLLPAQAIAADDPVEHRARRGVVPYAKRRCTGAPTCPAILGSGERYCPTHLAEYEKRRGTTTQRGYGQAHRNERAKWQRRIDTGELVYCARGCGTRLTGPDWDLGHTDDRAAWSGPECRPCNRGDGGRKGIQARR